MRFTTFLVSFLILLTSCGSERKKSEDKNRSTRGEYLRKGEEIVDLTQAELLRNVSHAMKTGGPGYAIDFCNLQAMAIKDSLSGLHNCRIRRISDKYRNPADKPRTVTEKEQLSRYHSTHRKGGSPEPEVYFFDDRVEYYHPIVIKNGACLLCHGTPGKQISEETLARIEAHYPEDLATGFGMNDLRGAWKITFME